MNVEGLSPIKSGNRITGYKVTDAMFPQAELIKDAIEAAGYDFQAFAASYTGTSTNPALAELFSELIKMGRFDFFENTWLAIDPKQSSPVLSALINRFGLTAKETLFVNTVINRTFNLYPDRIADLTKDVNGYLYLIHASILLSNGQMPFTGSIFATVANGWWTMYPGTTSFPPVAVIRNIMSVLNGNAYAPTEQSRNFLSGLPGDQQIKHVIYLATKFSAGQFDQMLNSNVTARKALYFITEGGYTNFNDMFQIADTIPEEWFKELI